MGADFEAIGLTKDGRNSKIHAVVDEHCRPWAFVLTPGNTADCVMGEECVSLIPGIKQLVADKGYDIVADLPTDRRLVSAEVRGDLCLR